MPKTFEFQSKLPRLPVPPLEHTLKVYLESCLPFYSSSIEQHEYEKIVYDFFQTDGLASVLQKRLINYDKTQLAGSWLEKWWEKYAYLSWRNSVLVNSNWFVLVGPYKGMKDVVRTTEGFSTLQIKRAAGFASSFLDFKQLLDEEKIEPEITKQGPIDMHQYCRMFGVTRVPKPECDIIVGEHPCKSTHIIVLIKDQIFVVYVYDKFGGRIAIEEIEKQLRQCVDLVESSNSLQPPICLLSGQHRDKWAEIHGYLSQDPTNQASFAMIESAIFAVSLDHKIVPHGVSDFARNVFHGFDGRNRWFDKSLSIVVDNLGRLGVNGEHSPCDALVPAILVDFAARREPAQDPISITSSPNINSLEKLLWKIDSKIEKALDEAQVYANETIGDSDVEVLHYSGYGSDFMKKIGRMSPDSYSQICLQLAFYRIHGYCAGVYETASTRKYLHGRTETCRSLTPSVAQFVQTFDDASKSAKEKYEAFQNAAKSHSKYIQLASNGMGVDRHLLGLKLCMKPGESHEIFTHPIFAISSKWQLSTSALFSGERLAGTGFGTVYPDGYGMNYMTSSNMIKIGVESKFSCPDTSSINYIDTLRKVYDEIKTMCQEATSSPSKL